MTSVAFLAVLLAGLPAWSVDTASPAALAMRREYNEVSAAIDTLARLYGADRLGRLTDPDATPGTELPSGGSLVLLFWADDEAQVYLNGAPVGTTRLTPTRIEIPTFYLQPTNELTAHCWDTDRVESGFMAGLYVEDAAGVRPVLTTSEGFGWVADPGVPAEEIYYAHTQPDLPGAEVMWGPQLFGQVRLRVRFSTADVRRAALREPVGMAPAIQERGMDFHEVVSRLVVLEERRRELATRLEGGAGRTEHDIRFRGGAPLGLTYTLGSAAPLLEQVASEAVADLRRWVRQLPPAQADLVLTEARRLRGAVAATPVAPLDASAPRQASTDRRADYRPPEERGSAGQGRGTSATAGSTRGAARPQAPSRAFLVRMGLIAMLLTGWTGLAGWRGWRLWDGVSWEGGPA